jgi:uncharacterized membrane protein (Fun14 family)
LGFGGLMGICTGVAMKRIGNKMAAVIGTGFIVLQSMAYLGYIQIDYGKVTKDATKLVDQDGDGNLTSKDLKILWEKFKDILSYNLPSGAGFASGFFLGAYFGR